MTRRCSVDGCGKRHYCRGWCESHYQRWRKNGDPLGGKHYADNSGRCAADGCDSAAKLAGYCKRHHHKLRRYGDPLGGATYRQGQQEEWLQAHAGWQKDECLIWPFFLSDNGYGLTSAKPGRGAHRAMCVMVHGDPPSADHEVAHSCNVRACVNPHHLRWATKPENMADKVAHDTHQRGERNHNAKLTETEVRKLLELRGQVLLREASERFGVSIATVHRIWTGRAWAWLNEASK